MKKVVMRAEFTTFDIAEAWYLALSHCHDGQSSKEYKRLSHMSNYFTPNPWLSVERLNDNAKVIYDNAVEKLLTKKKER